MTKSIFQFNKPYISNIYFSENADFAYENKEIQIETRANVQKTNPIDRASFVKLNLEIGEKNDKAPFYINIEMVGRFFWTEDLDDKQIDMFLSHNAPALLVSYLRPYISMIVGASKYPSYDLPFINFS